MYTPRAVTLCSYCEHSNKVSTEIASSFLCMECITQQQAQETAAVVKNY